ncbi:TonB-dependent receptor [Mucilaginibacter gilvus]|uniref:TonB-dependent receptor n=1 Tax=Mucilaginibacter gilvus TaxID=2305909 RepID=A0A444MJA7_9SPHI|nr:TonB-dependent receptor [Mucilaginibacter gilvus]
MIRTIIICIIFLPNFCFAQFKKNASDTAKQLNEVIVRSKIDEALTQGPGNVSVINTRLFYNTNLTPVQLLRGTSGIKVKQDGGYGSRLDFFINGSTGKQLKFFIDGLPINTLGESTGINNLPVEQIERIEIYKGVIPVDLGADVLAGAVNIISRKEKTDYLEASYAISSFDTHRINLSGRKLWTKNFYTSIQAYGGYSKNNYGIDADNIRADGKIELIHVKRCHDRYENYIVKAEAAIVNSSFADLLSLSLNSSGFDKQLQNNLTMTQPYAYAAYRESLTGGILKYQKIDLLKHLNVGAAVSFNRLDGLFIDTARRITVWNGSTIKNDDGTEYYRSKGAEIGRTSYLSTYTNTLNQKLTAAYWFNSSNKLIFSNTLQHYKRSAKDTLAQRINNGLDLYNSPSSQWKDVAGLGYDGNLLIHGLKLSTAFKYFYTRQAGSYINFDRSFTAHNSTSKPGYNIALAYSLNPFFIAKASYEHAIRLPDAEEAFGDLILVNPNPDLKAEESNNFNLNILYNAGKLHAEATGFYRNVDHLIFLVPNSQGSAKSYNLLKAGIKGIESNIAYQATRSFTVNINATYQDLRSRSDIEGLGIPNDRYKGQRIPNIPYLLGNAGLTYRVIRKNVNSLSPQFWYNVNYTHSYYLYWANDGYQPDKITIPKQMLQNAGITFPLKRLTFSIEAYNLANAKTYDNFKAQLPGRSVSLKLRYYLLTENKKS